MNGEARSSRVVDQEAGSTPSTLRDEDHPSTQRLFRCLPFHLDLNPLGIVMAELVGTFILMFSVCGVISSTQLSGGQVGLLEYAATAGLSVVVVVYSIGHISGAHFNPSITIAFAVFGGFPWSQVPLYITAQTLGATAATLVGVSVYGVNADLMATKPALSCVSAFFVELIATSIVVFLASALHCGPHQNLGNLTGFVIGTVISLGVLITGFEILQSSGMEIGESSNALDERIGSMAVMASTTAPTTTTNEAFLNPLQQQQQLFRHPSPPHVGFYEQPRSLNINLNQDYNQNQQQWFMEMMHHPEHYGDYAYEQKGFPFIDDNHHQPQHQHQQILGDSSTVSAVVSSSSTVPVTNPNLTNNTWFR